jgi:group I intron endonuclease
MKYRYNDKFPIEKGIYLISFDDATKVYIGSTLKTKGTHKKDVGFNARWKRHLSLLSKNKHHSIKLQNAYKKHGIQNMFFEIIETLDGEDCLLKEQFWIDKYDSYKNGYNCCPAAGSRLGSVWKAESKKKVCKTKKQNYLSKIKKHETEVIELYNNYIPYREISQRLNISRYLIRAILHKNNIKIKNKGHYAKQKVFVYSKNGDLLSEHDSVLSCSAYYNIDDRKIWTCLHGRLKTYTQRIFSKVELTHEHIKTLLIKKKIKWSIDSRKKISETRKGNMPSRLKWVNIKQIDKQGNLVKIWNKISEIVDHFKLKNGSMILRSIKDRKRTYKKHYWEAEVIR